MYSRLISHIAVASIFLLCSTSIAFAEGPKGAKTTSNPKVELKVLKLRLRPLTQAELELESKAWMFLLEAQITKTSEIEIESLKAGDNRGEVLTQLTAAREATSALTDRCNTVLKAFKEKGGDIATQERYISAATSLTVDVKDVTDWQAIYATAWGWAKSKEGGIKWAVRIVIFFLTLIFFKMLSWILGRTTRKIVSRSKNFSSLLREFFVTTVRKVTMFVGVIVALSAFEVNTGPFVALIGGVGFVVAFALQGTLSNFAAGVMILLYRPYDVGDLVEAAGMTGIVSSMNLTSTIILTGDNQTVIVPNSSIWGGIIKNMTGQSTRRIDMSFGCGYDDDIEKAQSVLQEIVGNHPLVLQEPAPVIKLHELGDSSVNFVVRPWSKTSDYWTVYWDITKAVKQRFDAESLNFPYPTQDVNINYSPTPSQADSQAPATPAAAVAPVAAVAPN